MDRRLIKEAAEAVAEHGSISAAARSLGLPRKTLSDRYHAVDDEERERILETPIPLDPIEDQGQASLDVRETKDAATLTFRGIAREDIEQAIQDAGYSLDHWEITQVRMNQWQVAGKRKTGQDQEGRWKPEELWSQDLVQITVQLARKAPHYVQQGVESLLVPWSKSPPKLPKATRSRRLEDPHLLELSLFDAHFGKLCWGDETGDENYDLDIARDLYHTAITDLLDKVYGYQIAKVLFPVGQDFFHVDNWQSETTHGTRVDSTDDRFQRVFALGCESIRRAILACREVADVEVIWSPGNHDTTTSWYLVQVLAAYFHQDDHVHVDTSPNPRKYRQWGKTLIGYTHGRDERHQDLPLIMAKEQPELWSQTRYHVWHVGHYHKRKETRYNAGDTFNGVSVQVLPSLSGTDSWHASKGYVTPARAADAYLWSKPHGLAGFFAHNL